LAPPTVAEARAAIAEHLDDHYHFYGEADGVRIARKHLGWYTKDLAGGDAFRREVNAVDTVAAQLAAVYRFFDNLAEVGERLEYRAIGADVVDASAAFGRSRQKSLRGGEALAA
jgi:tRNA-dihydrouridine synthase B